MPTRKPSLGRQRVEMTKIKSKSQLQVTFSKRCAGLFKKASELCTLCGVEIAIIVFSPAGKPFSFGHPSVESIVNKFINQSGSKAITPPQALTPVEPRPAKAGELNQHLRWLLEQQELEKKKAEMLDELRQAGQTQFWWEAPVDSLALHELQQLQAALEELKKNVASFTSNPWPSFTSSPQVSPDAYEYVPAPTYPIPSPMTELGFY
uniref:MADS-box domain-containing protein n=1 Tax=Kalanchoe fedtschenkoi TaxID=63787 RepID=A0A7N0T4C1_KALFE